MNRLRSLFTLLNLHFAVVALLLLFDIVLGVRLVLAWRAIGSDQTGSFAQQEIKYGQLQAQSSKLQGLPAKVQQASDGADVFYKDRIAPNYSTIAAELDGLSVKDQVRLTQDQYSPAAAIEGLTEVRIDASLSGDYTPMMHFINDLERDKNHVFFIIDGLTFTGQQGGLVNLRLRLTTYLRAGASDLPAAPAAPERASLQEAR